MKTLTVVLETNEHKEIEYSTISFYLVAQVFNNMPINTQESNREYNRNILSSGVKSETCIYTGPLNWVLPDRTELNMPNYYFPFRISSCEIYNNGAINCYCRMLEDNRLIGFILVR